MLVYKYRGGDRETFERDLISLEKNYFWSASIEKLNDPCEAITNKSRFKKQYTWFGKLLGAKSKEHLDLLNENFEEVLSYDKKMGIYSLSQSFLDELLWAHYGNSHRGFCIEYDLEILLAADGAKNIFSFPISYEKNPPGIGLFDTGNSINGGLIKKMGFYKSKRWEYEKEYRIITNNIGTYSYNYKAVKSIFFGLRMLQSDKDAIMLRLKGRNIRYYQVEQIESTYNFRVKEIESSYPSEVAYLSQVPISVTKGNVLNYKILKSKIFNYLGVGEFDIELEYRVEHNTLKWLAAHLKENLLVNAKTLIINYYLSPFTIECIPYASIFYKDGKIDIQISPKE